MTARIETFRPHHAGAFERLNRAWLREHALLEHHDEEHLADPWGRFVAPGGQVFVALAGEDVIGTCAVAPSGAGAFELAKLTVAPEARGQGIGRQLVLACLAFASERGARRVELLSNSRLLAAVRLYESLGFRHRPVPPDVQYATADVCMEYVLDASAVPSVRRV